MQESTERKYEKAFEQAASLHPIFPNAAREQMAMMAEAILKANENYTKILSTAQGIPQKGGFLAEEFHAETFNLDAILKGKKSTAVTDNYVEAWQSLDLKKHDVPDMVIVKDGQVTSQAQSKYYATAEASATKASDPKYEGMDQLLVPSDQVAEATDYASPEAAPKITGQLEHDGVSSTELTKAEANEMGSGNLGKAKDIENRYQTRSTLTQMRNAAVGAAAMSAVVSGSINTMRYVQLAREGELTTEEATVKIIGETVAAAADSAVKASANAGVQSLMVRYGSEKAVTQVLAKQGLKSMMKTNAVTVGVVCAVDAVKDLVRFGMGDISQEEFFERQGKGLMTTSAGVVGGSLGLAGATTLATTFGVTAGTTAMTVASVIGGLSGGMIAGLAMMLAVENGIEKPYRDLVQNTSNLHEAARELERVSQTVLGGQVLFTKYIEADARLEEKLDEQFDRIDVAGNNALAAIMKI